MQTVVVLLASTRHSAETAVRVYSDVAQAFGLSVHELTEDNNILVLGEVDHTCFFRLKK